MSRISMKCTFQSSWRTCYNFWTVRMWYHIVIASVVMAKVSAVLPVKTVSSTVGETVTLGCDLRSPTPQDTILLVIWYRHSNDTPIYSYDMRVERLKTARWATEALRHRVHLRIESAVTTVVETPSSDHHHVTAYHQPEVPELANFIIQNISLGDEGIYRCRVDFNRSPTRNTAVNLIVIEPVRELVIVDWNGRPLRGHMSQPLPEGASANITCIAYGGRPSARVSWWRGGVLVDDTDEISPERQVTKNELHISRLARRDVLTTYMCQASNTPHHQPTAVIITIDMYLRPLDVRLEGSSRPLSAGIRQEVTCQTRGARPPANVTWWKDGFLIADADIHENISGDGNVTVSTLGMVPRATDLGMTLSCRAHNPHIPHSELKDTTMLQIHYSPVVKLVLGRNINASDIRESVDVYFECEVMANPRAHRVYWKHNGQHLHNNVSAGVIISNQTLVLQGVTRTSTGNYSCLAANRQGDSESNLFYLDVKYEPVCGNNVRTVYGASQYEEVHVECNINANPPVTTFRWSFNHTPGAGDVRDLASFSRSEDVAGRSIAHFTPITDREYGTLLCWGRNPLGVQKQPCTFHVIPVGKPDPPYKCMITNRTADSLSISCLRGFSGGLPQMFMMVVLAGDSEEMIANVTSKMNSDFHISGILPDVFYKVQVYAFNEKGRSKSSEPLIVPTLPQVLQKQRRTTTASAGSGDGVLSEGAQRWLYNALIVVISLALVVIFLFGANIWWSWRKRQHGVPAKKTNSASSLQENAKEKENMKGDFDDNNSEKQKDFCVGTTTVATHSLCIVNDHHVDERYCEAAPFILPVEDNTYHQQLPTSSSVVNYGMSACPAAALTSYGGRLDILPPESHTIHTLDSPQMYTAEWSSIIPPHCQVMPYDTKPVHRRPQSASPAPTDLPPPQLPPKMKIHLNTKGQQQPVKWSDDLGVCSSYLVNNSAPLYKKWKSAHISSDEITDLDVEPYYTNAEMVKENDVRLTDSAQYRTLPSRHNQHPLVVGAANVKQNAGTQTPILLKHKESVV